MDLTARSYTFSKQIQLLFCAIRMSLDLLAQDNILHIKWDTVTDNKSGKLIIDSILTLLHLPVECMERTLFHLAVFVIQVYLSIILVFYRSPA